MNWMDEEIWLIRINESVTVVIGETYEYYYVGNIF